VVRVVVVAPAILVVVVAQVRPAVAVVLVVVVAQAMHPLGLLRMPVAVQHLATPVIHIVAAPLMAVPVVHPLA
jgi:hypothetical protein